MNSKVFIVLGATALLILVLFLFAPTKSPEQRVAISEGTPHISTEQTDTSLLLSDQIESIEDSVIKDRLSMLLSNKNATSKDELWASYELFDSVKSAAGSAMVTNKIAEINSDDSLFFRSGNLFVIAASMEKNPEKRSLLYKEAIQVLQKAIDLDAEAENYKIAQATAYLEEGSQVMNGIQLLLGVVRNNPDNVNANLLLARYGLISGQFDKAIERLENVISLHPRNAEAHFILGEAYFGSGDQEKAINSFKKCRELVEDEDFRVSIDNYIERIENSVQ